MGSCSCSGWTFRASFKLLTAFCDFDTALLTAKHPELDFSQVISCSGRGARDWLETVARDLCTIFVILPFRTCVLHEDMTKSLKF